MAPPPPFESLRQLIRGCMVTQLVYVAAKLGIADRLAGGPRTATDLATEAEADPKALYRVLRALASLGVFAEDDGGRFRLTPAGVLLRRDDPDSLQGTALLWGETFWPACGALLHSVRTGQAAFDHLHGMGLFEYLRQHPQSAEIFDQAMTNLTRGQAAAILAAYDFGAIKKLVDVGGGQGSMLAAVLRAYPGMRGVLYDRAEVMASAKRTLAAEGVLDRCELARGDFFVSVPEGGDGYLLKDILHDWSDERALTILANCSRAMTADAKLVALQRSLPAGNVAAQGKLVDITMLAVTGGRERTPQEYAELFGRAGLRLIRVVAAKSEMVVLEGKKGLRSPLY